MLFDRDEDGVLSFQELQLVMKSMGQRPSGFLKLCLSQFIAFKFRRAAAGECAGGV